MALSYVLDEHLRRRLWKALLKHNSLGIDPVDVVRVGDSSSFPLGMNDRDVLLSAEREGRILITRDARSMPKHFAAHVRAGHHLPGIFLIRPKASLTQTVAFLVYAASSSKASEWKDSIEYIP
jgi:hypothetical protein